MTSCYSGVAKFLGSGVRSPVASQRGHCRRRAALVSFRPRRIARSHDVSNAGMLALDVLEYRGAKGTPNQQDANDEKERCTEVKSPRCREAEEAGREARGAQGSDAARPPRQGRWGDVHVHADALRSRPLTNVILQQVESRGTRLDSRPPDKRDPRGPERARRAGSLSSPRCF
jgi:hypothetical protein